MLPLFLLASGCVLNPLQGQQTTVQDQPVAAASTTAAEHTGLLEVVARLQAGETGSYDGMTIEAGTSFFAASGRLCKYITLGEQADAGRTHGRLACQGDGGWFFAPDIFTRAAHDD